MDDDANSYSKEYDNLWLSELMNAVRTYYAGFSLGRAWGPNLAMPLLLYPVLPRALVHPDLCVLLLID